MVNAPTFRIVQFIPDQETENTHLSLSFLSYAQNNSASFPVLQACRPRRTADEARPSLPKAKRKHISPSFPFPDPALSSHPAKETGSLLVPFTRPAGNASKQALHLTIMHRLLLADESLLPWCAPPRIA